MTLITFQDGKVVMRDGKVGTEQECCCGTDCLCCPTSVACLANIAASVDEMGQMDPLIDPESGLAFLYVTLGEWGADGLFRSAGLYCVDGVWVFVASFTAYDEGINNFCVRNWNFALEQTNCQPNSQVLENIAPTSEGTFGPNAQAQCDRLLATLTVRITNNPLP